MSILHRFSALGLCFAFVLSAMFGMFVLNDDAEAVLTRGEAGGVFVGDEIYRSSRSLSGGKLPKSLSIVLLNRGGRPFKSAVFSELFDIGASEIISIEGPSVQYDIENLSRKYPEVRFLLLAEQVTIGERLNL